MLLRMLPEQISKQWDLVRAAIEAANPPDVVLPEHKMTNMLSMLLNGDMQCWVLVGDEVRTDVYAIVTTLTYDDPFGEKQLFVYSLYAYKRPSRELWMDLINTLKRWGESLGCSNVTAYVRNKSEIRLIERIGGDVETVLVRIPLKTNGRL